MGQRFSAPVQVSIRSLDKNFALHRKWCGGSRGKISLDCISDIPLISPHQIPASEENPLVQSKDFISIRVDGELKKELLQASDVERRSLSNFCRLLLEYAWGEYLKAGSMRNLLDAENPVHRGDEWRFKPQQ